MSLDQIHMCMINDMKFYWGDLNIINEKFLFDKISKIFPEYQITDFYDMFVNMELLLPGNLCILLKKENPKIQFPEYVNLLHKYKERVNEEKLQYLKNCIIINKILMLCIDIKKETFITDYEYFIRESILVFCHIYANIHEIISEATNDFNKKLAIYYKYNISDSSKNK